MSQAYRFRQGDAWYVIRISHSTGGYLLDRYAYENFAETTGLPIPNIHVIGTNDNVAYAISDCAPGNTLAHLRQDDVRKLLPELLVLLQKLQRAKPENPDCFGAFNREHKPSGSDWRSGLEKFFSLPESGYWYDWHSLFNDDWIRADVFWPMHERMLHLAKYTPQVANVVHGDFHTGNILADGSSITGLIDWAQMLWGDWVFDAATFQFWSPEYDFAHLVFEQGEAYRLDLSHYQERFWCSCYAIGLDALRFKAKIGDISGCRYVVDRLQTMEESAWARF